MHGRQDFLMQAIANNGIGLVEFLINFDKEVIVEVVHSEDNTVNVVKLVKRFIHSIGKDYAIKELGSSCTNEFLECLIICP